MLTNVFIILMAIGGVNLTAMAIQWGNHCRKLRKIRSITSEFPYSEDRKITGDTVEDLTKIIARIETGLSIGSFDRNEIERWVIVLKNIRELS